MAIERDRRREGRLLLGCALAAALSAAATPCGAGESPRYEVVVGGRKVPGEIVQATIDMKRAESRVFHGGGSGPGDERAEKAALDTLVGRQLLVRAAGERGIRVTEKEIGDYAEGKARALGGREKFTNYLANANVPWDVYLGIAGDSLLASRYAEREIEPRIQVSEDDVGAYYRQNLRSYVEPSTKTIDELVVTMNGEEPSAAVEAILPPVGIPFKRSTALPELRGRVKRAIAGAADVALVEGIELRETSAAELWKQIEAVGPGEGIVLKAPEKGRMVYRCVSVVGLAEGKKVSLQEATPAIRKKVLGLKKGKAVQDEVERLKTLYPVEIRRLPD